MKVPAMAVKSEPALVVPSEVEYATIRFAVGVTPKGKRVTVQDLEANHAWKT